MSRQKPSLLPACGRCISLGGLVVIAGLWLSAAIIAMVHGDRRAGLTIGIASGEQWLSNVVIRGDGSVLLQHFHQNLTGQDGLYVKAARTDGNPRFIASIAPRTTSNAISKSLTAHILLLLLPFLVLTGYTVVWPLLRRSWRRRRLACVGCGYPLRAAASDACPECGYANTYLGRQGVG